MPSDIECSWSCWGELLKHRTQAGCRRMTVLSTILGTLAATARRAEAEQKFETMEGLKGRDYGKERQKYVNAAYPKYSWANCCSKCFPQSSICWPFESQSKEWRTILTSSRHSPLLTCMTFACRYSDYVRTDSGLQYQVSLMPLPVKITKQKNLDNDTGWPCEYLPGYSWRARLNALWRLQLFYRLGWLHHWLLCMYLKAKLFVLLHKTFFLWYQQNRRPGA